MLHLVAKEKPRHFKRSSVEVLLCIRHHPNQLILWRKIPFQIRLGQSRLQALDLMMFQAAFKERCPSGDSAQLRVSLAGGFGERLEVAEESWLWTSHGKLGGMDHNLEWRREDRRWSTRKCRGGNLVENGFSSLQESGQMLISWPFPKIQVLPLWILGAKRRIFFQIQEP